ncbi:phosphotransferase [Dactylosporangium sp. CA-052675]|uniref:phosphotransferase n=1 Tax=Dactylosporangium sp. CA-052675 TaxID=3239927 RepID=UPI003D8F08DA
MTEPEKSETLEGGRTTGAQRIGDTIRKPARPWTPAVHAVLAHLEAVGFEGAPRPRGLDEQGREVLTYLPGQTIGDVTPWAPWVFDDTTLDLVGAWLRGLHDATEGWVPPADAVWMSGVSWRPGLVIGHQDAGPYNAVWHEGRIGFVDWEVTGPSSREFDIAFAALWWVPLHAEHVARAVGFTAFEDRARRLHRLLDAYGYEGDRRAFGVTVAARIRRNAEVLRRLAATGDPVFARNLPMTEDLETAARQVEALPESFWTR